jgi:hypothetical protein
MDSDLMGYVARTFDAQLLLTRLAAKSVPVPSFPAIHRELENPSAKSAHNIVASGFSPSIVRAIFHLRREFTHL